MSQREAYKKAGIDLDEAAHLKRTIWDLVKTTFPAQNSIVSEGGDYSGVMEPHPGADYYLVTSTDGVGTKARVAALANRHEVVGMDIVNHCVNDILPAGAKPLFMLDYIGLPEYSTEKVAAIVRGIVSACRAVNCALIGGETAAMPGIYQPQDYEIVGFIVGTVAKKDYLQPRKTVKAGDAVLALPSNGVHTNGFTMIRRAFGLDQSAARLNETVPDTDMKLGDALLQPHRCYLEQLQPVLAKIKGLAHITGGGIYENIPRTLPDDLAVELDGNSWRIPPLFKFIQNASQTDTDEMFRVFNMGIGMVIIAAEDEVAALTAALPDCWRLGRVVPNRTQRVQLLN